MLNAQMREKLLDLSTPLLVDARDRLALPESHLDSGIKPVVPFTRMAGGGCHRASRSADRCVGG